MLKFSLVLSLLALVIFVTNVVNCSDEITDHGIVKAVVEVNIS